MPPDCVKVVLMPSQMVVVPEMLFGAVEGVLTVTVTGTLAEGVQLDPVQEITTSPLPVCTPEAKFGEVKLPVQDEPPPPPALLLSPPDAPPPPK